MIALPGILKKNKDNFHIRHVKFEIIASQLDLRWEHRKKTELKKEMGASPDKLYKFMAFICNSNLQKGLKTKSFVCL